jgi:thiol-disulfide isomerase/thioredoxin
MIRRLSVMSLAILIVVTAAYTLGRRGRSTGPAEKLTVPAVGTAKPADSTKELLIPAKNAHPAPEFFRGEWINSAPLKVDDLHGQVVVVDFWTFGCYNCRNTLPALKHLYGTYKDRGLTIVGVHTPEVERERKLESVRREVASLGIAYPVVTDNEYNTWRAFEVEAWPTVFIVDKQGRVRYKHIGEGAYDEQEAVVKRLLAE